MLFRSDLHREEMTVSRLVVGRLSKADDWRSVSRRLNSLASFISSHIVQIFCTRFCLVVTVFPYGLGWFWTSVHFLHEGGRNSGTPCKPYTIRLCGSWIPPVHFFWRIIKVSFFHTVPRPVLLLLIIM